VRPLFSILLETAGSKRTVNKNEKRSELIDASLGPFFLDEAFRYGLTGCTIANMKQLPCYGTVYVVDAQTNVSENVESHDCRYSAAKVWSNVCMLDRLLFSARTGALFTFREGTIGSCRDRTTKLFVPSQQCSRMHVCFLLLSLT
jgi:hypothetical protein